MCPRAAGTSSSSLPSRSPSPNQDRQLPSSVMAARDSNAGWAGEHAVSIGIGCAARTPRDVGSEWTEVGRRATGFRFGVPAGRGGSQMALAPHFRTTGFEPGPDSRRASWPRAPARQPLGSLTPTPLSPPRACRLEYFREGSYTGRPVGRRSCPRPTIAGQPSESIRLPIRSKAHCMQLDPARCHAHAFGALCFASITTPPYPTLPFQVCGFNDAAPASGPATEETPETSGLLTRSPCPVPVVGVASQVVVAFVGGGRRNDVTAARLRAQVQAMSKSADKPSLLLLLLLYPNASCQRWPAFAMTVVLAGMAPPPRLAPSGNPLPARLGTAFSAPGACGGAALWVLDFRDHAVGLFGCGQVDEPNFTHLFWDSRKHLYRLDIPLHRLISRHGHRLSALDMNLSISPPWRRHPPPRTATALFWLGHLGSRHRLSGCNGQLGRHQ